MQKLVVIVLVLLVALAAMPALGQDQVRSRLTLEPSAAYRVFIPPDPDMGFQALWAGTADLGYLIPATRDGQHNIRVAGGAGIATDLASAGFRLGYAYAPIEINDIIFGFNGAFDILWPQEGLIDKTLGKETGSDTWVSAGIEGALDFPVPVLGNGSLSVYYLWGMREAPDSFGFAFSVAMQPVSTEERVKRADE